MKKKKIIYTIILIIILLIPLFYLFNQKYNPPYTIPKVYFEGDISNMYSKADERKISLKYVSNDINFESYALIKVQGTSSLYYEKKNYTIKLYEDVNYENKNKVDVGWGKQNKYCLKANWIDKTHARNVVTAKLVSQVQEKYNILTDSPNNGAIDGYPVEIYINGEFLGLYTWNIPKDAWMFNMDENNENHIVFVSEGYNSSNLFESEAKYGDWDIEVGKANERELKKLNEVVNFVLKSDDKTFKKDFEKHFNLDATLNYVVMTEFAALYDNRAKNMLLATYNGDVWYPLLYDLDTSWGTNYDGWTLVDYTDTNHPILSKLWERVVENFSNELNERYFELRKNILTKENVMKEFEDFKKLIPDETFEKEKERWQDIPGYDYKQIEEFLDTRIPIVDKFMSELIK